MSTLPEREQRLLNVIKKLESKVRTIWEENGKLKQRVELADLDKEIAEEQYQALKEELKNYQVKIDELEELRKLSDELEVSYTVEKQELEAQCSRLEHDLHKAHLQIQNHESLQLKLADTTRLLEFANLELNIMKNGAAKTLTQLFNEESYDWLLLIDILKIDIAQPLTEYKSGNISVSKFAQLLFSYVDKSIDEQRISDIIMNDDSLDSIKIQNRESPLWSRLMETIERIQLKRSTQPDTLVTDAEKAAASEITDIEQQKRANLELRISILEEKLSKAQDLAKELDDVRQLLKESEDLATRSDAELARYKDLIRERDQQIAELRRNNLPHELSEAKNNDMLKALNSCIAFLSTERPKLVLDDLDIHAPAKISILAGNKRIKNLRKLAITSELGKTPQEARELAIEQETNLCLL